LSLLSDYRDQRKKAVEDRVPHAHWTHRTVYVKHGRLTRLKHAYPAVLHHPPDRDVDKDLRSATRRARHGRAELPLEKAADRDREALPSEGRWLTIHPDGKEEPGRPVFLMPNHDGSWSIAAGCGGKLNGLRITKIKPEAEYRKEAAAREREKNLARKLEQERRKQEMGEANYAQLQLAKQTRQAELDAADMDQQKKLISGVCAMQGIDPASLGVPGDMSRMEPRVRARLEKRAHEAALTWAKEVVAKTEEIAQTAYSTLSSEQTGDIPLTDTLSGSTGDTGKGYQAQVKAMAEENGLTRAGARAGAKEISWRGMLDRSDYEIPKAENKAAMVEKMQQGAATARMEDKSAQKEAEEKGGGPLVARQLDTTPKAENMGDVVTVLKLKKEMDMASKAIRQASAEVKEADDAAKLPKLTAVMAGADMSEEQVLQAVADTLGEKAMRKSMERIFHTAEQLDRASGSLQAHYSVGQSACFNTITQAVDGSTIDPLLVDTIGAPAAAAVLAAKWKAELSPEEFKAVRDALDEQHIATQEAIANKAVDVAEQCMAEHDAIEVNAQPSTPEDVEAALLAHAEKVEYLRMARQAVGIARGRLEAAASLNDAMAKAGKETVTVNLGPGSSDDALTRVYALGLNDPSKYNKETGTQTHDGEFTIHSDGQNKILEIHPKGLAKLATPADKELQERAQRTAAIKNGEQDDPDWLPQGISRRPVSTFEADPLTIRSVDHVLNVRNGDSPEEMAEKIREHIGGRMAEGCDPLTISGDIRSGAFLDDLGLDSKSGQVYNQALAMAAPSFEDSVRAQIQADMPKGLKPGTPEYNTAYQEARKAHKAKLFPSKEAYTEAQAQYREGMRKRYAGYASEYTDRRVKDGSLSAADAPLDNQHVPLSDQTHEALFQAVSHDPRTQHAFIPLGELDKGAKRALREYALEKILKVDEGDDRVISRLSPEQTKVHDAYRKLRTEVGSEHFYSHVQEDIRKRDASGEDNGFGMFGEEDLGPKGMSLGDVDLHNDMSVLKYARENAGALGYKAAINPATGEREFVELQRGRTFQAQVGNEGGSTEVSGLSDGDIASEARSRIRGAIRKHYIGAMLGMPEVAESGFNPESVTTSSNRWTKYKEHMGSLEKAYQTVQEHMAGSLTEEFAKEYQKATGQKLQVGQRTMEHAERHAMAAGDPDTAERLMQQQRSVYARAARRNARGQFGQGERRVLAENKKHHEAETSKLLGESESGDYNINVKRSHLGSSVEGTLKGMMPYMPIDRPIEAARGIGMGGDKAEQQRAIKAWEENKRMAICCQAGFGKTLIGMGAFSDLQAQGKAKRALYLVPSNIVGQFGSEFLKFLDPKAALRWHADPAASKEERRAALSDPGSHMVVCTPEAIRGDITAAVAEDLGCSERTAIKKMEQMSPEDVDRAVHGAMDKRGWQFDFQMHDEGHRGLNRAGKPDSHMARIMDSVGRKAEYYGYSTADAVKNDVSEAHSVMSKINPAKYPPESRDAWMRKYGRGDLAAGLSMRQEMEPYMFTSTANLGTSHERHLHTLDMTPEQAKDYTAVKQSYQEARRAAAVGDTPGLIAALKDLAPNSFSGSEPESETAARLKGALGTLRESALNRVTNLHEKGAKLDWVDHYLGEHKGEPAVVFAHNLAAVDALKKRAKAAGHRVVTLSGAMSSQAKDQAKNAFAPTSGEATADVLMSSDAGCMGANLQRGYHMINYDTPQTSMTHEQRIAREDRRGQKNHVFVHDLVTDCDYEKRNRRRLERKSRLRELMTSSSEMLDDSGLMGRIHSHMVRAVSRGGSESNRKEA
jgi:hypothetical protein